MPVSELEEPGFDRWNTQWIRNRLGGFTPRAVVNGSISTAKEQQVLFLRGQCCDWHSSASLLKNTQVLLY